MSKKKKPRWELLPKKDREIIEKYAQLREEYYHPGDVVSSSTMRRYEELPALVEEAYLKLVNLLIRLRREAKRNRLEKEAPKFKCNWCEDPKNPDPKFHPDGGPEHVVVSTDPRFRVEFRVETEEGVGLTPRIMFEVDAPTENHAVVLTKRRYGHIKVLRIINLTYPTQGQEPPSDVTKDPPGQ